MLAIVKSMALNGLEGYIVSIQVDVSNGLPSFEIVGLPGASVKEAKERVKIAIKNLNYKIHNRKTIVNLAPASTRKDGSMFDLPIALGILITSGNITNTNVNKILSETIFIGELSLRGTVEKVKGILPICIEARKLGIKRIVLPYENAKEASFVQGIEILPVKSLGQVVKFLNGKFNYFGNKFGMEKIDSQYDVDFEEVKGQEEVKRALEVAAAGGHNCLLIGPPGSGKTMLANRFKTILRDMTFEESLETTKIHSIAGLLSENEPFVFNRPFRSPHHLISEQSLIGGGRIPTPGEISLAHFGVLYLDELTEFDKKAIEVLRGPLEDRKVTISRVAASITYPANFILIASMNPCPCGYYGSTDKKCSCTKSQIDRYFHKISGPILDRIDLHIEVGRVKFNSLKGHKKIETSAQIKKRVDAARKIQIERYKNENIYCNSELTPNLIKKYCKLNAENSKLLEKAFNNLGLSARAYNKILKVARTIADLEKSAGIETKHLAEAIQYRNLDRKYWGEKEVE